MDTFFTIVSTELNLNPFDYDFVVVNHSVFDVSNKIFLDFLNYVVDYAKKRNIYVIRIRKSNTLQKITIDFCSVYEDGSLGNFVTWHECNLLQQKKD